MKHHALTAATGLLIATVLVPTGHAQAASADPTGIWRKADQGERPGKIQLYRCGSGKRYLCAKIIWLQNPNDSQGRPLHDVRNENPSMRDRPILGLPIITGLAPAAPNVWKGSIYNPEDGNTYSATLTLVSRNQINLKGCKAWLLCGERTWLRTSLPKPEPAPEPEPQIEASAEPEAAEPEAAVQPAAAEKDPLSEAEMLTPAVEHGTRPGYRFLNASSTAQTSVELSGENVPSMFAMTTPVAETSPAAEPATPASTTATAAPAPKPKSQTVQANAAPAPRPATATRAAALPAGASASPSAANVAAGETETAETDFAEEAPMTRRQRRLLRRQRESQGLLPWQN
jgi:uncharacterized protein (DUF2147 family)